MIAPATAVLVLTAAAAAQPLWQRIDDVERPAPRWRHALAYDLFRSTTLLFGGLGEAQTWEFIAGRWVLRRPAHSPPPRDDAAMIYDLARRRVVLFGGDDNGRRLSDTWEWDGADWIQRQPRTVPAGIFSPAMAYDPVRGRSVMVGNNQTWEWDGTDWRWVQSARFVISSGTALAYHGGWGQVVAFGGHDGFNGVRNGLWRYDGASWQAVAVSGPLPRARREHSLIFDSFRSRLVLYGGVGSTGAPVFGDTWEFDGAGWVELQPVVAPQRRGYGAMAFHGPLRSALLFGGYGTQFFGDTWSWDGTAWSKIGADADPGQRSAYTLDYDRNRGRALLFGGITQGSFLPDELWQRDATGWQPLPVAGVRPPGRFAAAAAHDPRNDRLVVFGGRDATVDRGDTWVFSNGAWTEVIGPGPLPRQQSAAAYDPGRDRVVLFGGLSNWNVDLGDTWLFDGSGWSPLAGPAPTARRGMAMGFDPIAGRVLLFGGLGPAYMQETWVLDGTGWRQIVTANSPPARSDASLVFDESRQAMLLIGGVGLQPLFDTWEFDGADWQLVVDQGNVPWIRESAYYDVALRRTTMFDGYQRQMWVLTEPDAAAFFPYGDGCANRPSRPLLRAFGGDRPFLGEHFDLEGLGMSSSPFALLMVGNSDRDWFGLRLPFDLTVIGMTSCQLLVRPDITVTMLVANGRARTSLQVPPDNALLGASFYNQIFQNEPFANPLGAVVSNAGRGVIGVR